MYLVVLLPVLLLFYLRTFNYIAGLQVAANLFPWEGSNALIELEAEENHSLDRLVERLSNPPGGCGKASTR